MNDGDKVVVDVLYREFARVQAKSVATDDWFFRFLSIAVVPFLAFVAYALGKPEYRIFIAALPFLSIIGVAVVLVLATHYIFATSYCAYLERRLNVYLVGTELCDARLNRRAYRIWSSPVSLSYVVGFAALVASNLAAIPAINATFVEFLATHPNLPPIYREGLFYYWPIVLASASLFVTAGIAGLVRTRRVCKVLASEHDDAQPRS